MALALRSKFRCNVLIDRNRVRSRNGIYGRSRLFHFRSDSVTGGDDVGLITGGNAHVVFVNNRPLGGRMLL